MTSAQTTYLFLGPEEGLKADEVSNIRQGLAKKLGAPPDEHRFYVPDESLSQVVDVLRNGSLFAAHRLVIVSGVDQVRKKAELQPLLDYLAAPSPEATLVLLADSLRVDPKIDRLVPGEHRKVFWEMFENQKHSWILAYFRRHRVTISDEAIDLILEVVENNTQELRRQAEKLCTFVGPDGSVGVDEVDTFIYHSREENVFTLFAHVAADNFEAALMALDKLTTSGESNPVQTIGGLVFQFRRLLALRLLLDNDVSLETAFSRLNIRGKRIQSEYGEGVRKYMASELESSIHLLTEYDALFRSQRPGIHRCLLELMVYQLFYSSTRLVRAPRFAGDISPISDPGEEAVLVR
jgi:DNA polymerase-3 subunit delta